jgi:glyoxylase-like metal-dependent hydrolase (beta-lactamase superfamily II)
VRRIAEGIAQLVTPFSEFSQEEALRLREDLEAHPRVTKGLPYVLPYLITSGGESLLVDCGWNTDAARAALEDEVRAAGANLADIGAVLVTHAHPDHGGMAGRLRNEFGCRVLLHEQEEAFLASRYASPGGLVEDVRRWLCRHGVPAEEAVQLAEGSLSMRPYVADLTPDWRLTGGEELRVGAFVFEVIWTPGHAPGHVCLYERNHKLLLTGDHVLPTITPNVSLHPQQPGSPLAAYLTSLARVEQLDVARMLPAHEWDIGDFQGRVREIRAHHEERLQVMLAAVDPGGSTAAQVAQRVAWTTGRYEDFPPFMRRAAIGETLAHLEYLATQGMLRTIETDGVACFVPA